MFAMNRLSVVCLLLALATEVSASTLNATVRNVASPNCSVGSTVAGATVVRYSSGWAYLDERTTNSSGVATWSSIPGGSYWLEVYYNGEFWGTYSVTVPSSGTTSVTLVRNMPYRYDFRVFNGSTDVTGGTVAPGTSLSMRVLVRNCSSDPWPTRAKLWADRDQASPYDFSQTSASQTIAGSGGSYTFTFPYTPTNPGTYYRRIEIEAQINGNWVKTDSLGWGTAFIVSDPRGDSNATVRNVASPNCSAGSTVAGATVLRYSSGWAYLDERTTNSSGVASWTNIPAGSYYLEVYQNTEFWGSYSVTVSPGGPTNLTLVRDMPYTYECRAYNGSSDITGGTVPPGTSLSVRLSVRNCSADSLPVRVTLWIDRDRASAYDFVVTSSSQTVTGSGGSHTFAFAYTPLAPGTYYRRLEVESYVNNNWIRTDSWTWDPIFVAAPNILSLPGSVAGTLWLPGDFAWYAFDALSGHHYWFDVHLWFDNPVPAPATRLELLAGDGQPLLFADNDSGAGEGSRIDWTAPAAGRYYLRLINRCPLSEPPPPLRAGFVIL